MPPIRALIEQAPRPAFLMTVGNCSTLKTYTVPYEEVMASLPNIAKVMVNQFISAKDYPLHTLLAE